MKKDIDLFIISINTILTLMEKDYQEFFEYNKIFVLYMNTFVNQEFNQNLKEYSFNYVKKLLKVFKFTIKKYILSYKIV